MSRWRKQFQQKDVFARTTGGGKRSLINRYTFYRFFGVSGLYLNQISKVSLLGNRFLCPVSCSHLPQEQDYTDLIFPILSTIRKPVSRFSKAALIQFISYGSKEPFIRHIQNEIQDLFLKLNFFCYNHSYRRHFIDKPGCAGAFIR